MADQLLDGTRRIDAPTPLVRGAMSDLVSPDTVNDFLTAVHHTQAVDVSDTGYMVAGGDNDAFTTEVLAFLDRVAPSLQPR